MYYKIYKSYYDDLEKVNQLLDENSILFPVLKLLKMFLIANSQVDAGRVIKENKSLFDEIKQYISFFNEDLCELVDVLSLLFEPTIPEKIMMKSYKNSLAYFSLSSRLCADKRYVESLFVGKKAEEVLVREKNYKRLLFLTANHCLNGGGDAISSPNCGNAVFFWHYESPNCNNLEEDPDYYIETVGATVLANDSVLDFALLELRIDSNDILNIMTYYLGWDRRPYLGADDSTAVGIHHPRGDIKKISTSRNIQSDGNHWMVLWKETEHGHSVTEPISSGSPLINGNNHVIGCLFGGESYDCSCPNKDTAYYNKLDRAWFGDDATDNR
mgnify:CR=1 FL=1